MCARKSKSTRKCVCVSVKESKKRESVCESKSKSKCVCVSV